MGLFNQFIRLSVTFYTYLSLVHRISAQSLDIPSHEDRVIVRYKTSKSSLNKGIQGVQIIDLQGQPLEEAMAILQLDDRVLDVEPDYQVNLLQNEENVKQEGIITPNDRWFGWQWGHTAAKVQEAWQKSTGTANVSVCVIDTGIDFNHTDIAPNYLFGYNAITGSSNAYDDNGHGTHCAGIIGSMGNNSIGIAGVNWKVGLVGCKALDSKGSGYMSSVLKCIDFCLRHKVTISSNSYAMGGLDRSSSILRYAISQAASQDHLFVAAAGNDGYNNDENINPSFPAGFDLDNIISVAAVEDIGGGVIELAPYSNHGNHTTHLGAPGTDILSTWPGNYMAYLSGTSMACPYVAGAAALLKGYSGGMLSNIRHIKAALLNSTISVSSLEGKTSTGGMLDVAAAMTALDSLQQPAVLPPLQVSPPPPSPSPLPPPPPPTEEDPTLPLLPAPESPAPAPSPVLDDEEPSDVQPLPPIEQQPPEEVPPPTTELPPSDPAPAPITPPVPSAAPAASPLSPAPAPASRPPSSSRTRRTSPWWSWFFFWNWL